jgi:hypothetical protein
LSVEVLMRPTLNTYQFTFFPRKSASVATSWLRIFTLVLQIGAGIALNVLGNWKGQLFRHTNTGDFSSVLRNAVSVTLTVFLLTLIRAAGGVYDFRNFEQV